jgi:hypothetical protein
VTIPAAAREISVEWSTIMRTRKLALAAAMTAAALVASPLNAATFTDLAGDFLATYTGPHNGDLDILFGSVAFDSDELLLSSTMNGPIGTTTGSVFLWGVNRGAGTNGLTTSGPPAVGDPGILLDAVVRLEANGTGRVVTFPSMGAPTTVLLDASMISISGATISGRIPTSLLASTGFAFADYTYEHWSRSALGSQAFIADIAPDPATVTANFVPEPAAWALMLAGFGLAGAALRRRGPARA